jgi:recombination DNA repair RAD52 pathway protein
MNNQLIKPEDLSLTDSALNGKQLSLILKRTPEKYVKTRPAKGGGQWKYVSGGYVKKCLNLMFGFQWSFEILEQMIMHNEAIVKGKLTIQSNGQTIVKMQFGNKDIMYKKGTETPLSIGNDLKAAATDCLKKCAAEIGIAADIYNAEEFREIQVDLTTDDDVLNQLIELYALKGTQLSIDETNFIDEVVNKKKTEQYTKALNILKSK